MKIFTMKIIMLISVLGSLPIKGIISEVDIEHKNTTQCLWIEGTDGVQNQTVVNLSCTSGSVYVVQGLFIRPRWKGDSACFDWQGRVKNCCNTLKKPVCDTSMDVSKMNVECEGYQNCSFVVETSNLESHCYDQCRDESYYGSCWPRFLQIIYICISTASETEAADGTTPVQLSSHAPDSSSSNVTVIVLAILLPIAFLGGGLLVHLLYTRCDFMKKFGTNKNPPFSDLKGLQNPTAETDKTVRATSPSEDPVFPYCKKNQDSRASDADHEYVILADDKLPRHNGIEASGREKQPEMFENLYYNGLDGNNKPKASGYQDVLNNGVEMTENAYYDGTEDLKMTSGALPNTLGHDATDGEVEMTENTYYDGTDNGPGIKDCHDGQKNEGEKNYVYTYGHFKLEGRQREEH